MTKAQYAEKIRAFQRDLDDLKNDMIKDSPPGLLSDYDLQTIRSRHKRLDETFDWIYNEITDPDGAGVTLDQFSSK
jgi:hypothetical protein